MDITEKKKRQKNSRAKGWRQEGRIPPSVQYMATVITNFQQLWMTTLGLYKSKHIKSQAWIQEGPRTLPLMDKLFPTGKFRGSGNHCLQVCTHY